MQPVTFFPITNLINYDVDNAIHNKRAQHNSYHFQSGALHLIYFAQIDCLKWLRYVEQSIQNKS